MEYEIFTGDLGFSIRYCRREEISAMLDGGAGTRPGFCMDSSIFRPASLLPIVRQRSCTVSDPSGAVLQGVTVTLTNTNTGDRRDSVTDASGSYQILNVLPGTYKIDVESPGFRHFTRLSIEVQTQAAVRIDVPLVIGNITETVEITASTVLLETDKSSMGRQSKGLRCSNCRSMAAIP